LEKRCNRLISGWQGGCARGQYGYVLPKLCRAPAYTWVQRVTGKRGFNPAFRYGTMEQGRSKAQIVHEKGDTVKTQVAGSNYMYASHRTLELAITVELKLVNERGRQAAGLTHTTGSGHRGPGQENNTRSTVVGRKALAAGISFV
jgi:hypothetical protein